MLMNVDVDRWLLLMWDIILWSFAIAIFNFSLYHVEDYLYIQESLSKAESGPSP